MGLRDFAGVRDEQPLDPFALAEFAKLLVIDFHSIQGLSRESREHLLGKAANSWSGGASSRPLPNGWRLVILNPSHGKHRNRATLMEEIAHVFLGHEPNRLAIISRNPNVSEGGKRRDAIARDYNHDDEEAAYAVGTAALVPYQALRRLVLMRRSTDQIARHFRVSRALVEYRIKVTHLWAEYKRASATRAENV